MSKEPAKVTHEIKNGIKLFQYLEELSLLNVNILRKIAIGFILRKKMNIKPQKL
jgi:hypothetical protein